MQILRININLKLWILLLVALSACGPGTAPSTPGTSDTPVETAAPRIVLLRPSAAQTVTTGSVEVAGQVLAEAGLSALEYRLNGGEAQVLPVETGGTAQDFDVKVDLQEGDNALVLTVTDARDRQSSTEVKLTRDSTGPHITLAAPAEETRPGTWRFPVNVAVEDASGVSELTWSLNGEAPVALDPTQASGSLGLEPAPGSNTLVVRGRDSLGNTSETSISFYFGFRTAAGGLHSGTVRDGVLYTWGRNNRGQLGVGTTTDSKLPLKVEGLSDVASIAFSQNSSLAVRTDGSVWTWGENSNGQLGLGQAGAPDTTVRQVPTRITGISDAVAGALGYTHGLVLHHDGHVSAFGKNSSGQLGDGTTTDRSYPMPVMGLTDVIRVLGGSQHSAALRRDGTVWVWGSNAYGNLGTGAADKDAHPTPTQVPGLTDVVDIANGRDHVLAVRADGSVWSWGLDANGQLGDGQSGTSSQSATPGPVKGLASATAVFAQGNMSFARLADGTLWGWGQNFNGQLGTGDTTELSVPTTPVLRQLSPQDPMRGLVDVSPGATHVISRNRDGTVFSWGWSSKGSLGGQDLLENWPYPTPLQVVLP